MKLLSEFTQFPIIEKTHVQRQSTEDDSCHNQEMARLFAYRRIRSKNAYRLYTQLRGIQTRECCTIIEREQYRSTSNFEFNQRKQNTSINGTNFKTCRDYSKTNQKLALSVDNANHWLDIRTSYNLGGVA